MPSAVIKYDQLTTHRFPEGKLSAMLAIFFFETKEGYVSSVLKGIWPNMKIAPASGLRYKCCASKY